MTAVACALALTHAALAGAASSASFQIQNAVIDTAGGRSTSATHVVTACVGSEIAGSSASASFKMDSGCGATALFVPPTAVVAQATVPVPTMSSAGSGLLMVLVALAGFAALRRRSAR
ncbi:MAG: hypothetical protein ABI585_01060 [Betaproteobacteria bacterium]